MIVVRFVLAFAATISGVVAAEPRQQQDASAARIDAIFANWNRPNSAGCGVGVSRGDEKTDLNEAIVRIVARQRGLNFAPGTEFQYSNSGYVVLANIVKRVSGQSLRAFADANIFKPRGMTQTHVHDDPAMAVPNRAIGYRQSATGPSRIAHADLGRLVGTTGVLTTVRDMLRWQQNFAEVRVGEPVLVAAMQTPMVLADGTTAPYGFGLWIEPDGDLRTNWRFWRHLAVAALLAVSSSALIAQQPPFVEHVEVARLLVDARVFDERGRPMRGLQPSEFAVKIDGKSARVESAEWVGAFPDSVHSAEGEVQQPRSRTADERDERVAASRSRLVVFIVQKDLEPSRIVGLMKISQLVDELLRPLTSADRVAVVSFDSRLRIWTDFTNNIARVRSILSRDVIVSRPGPVSASDDVSLLPTLEEQSARRISSIEDALRLIAESLEPLPGAKSLVLLGYGFGRFDARSGGVLLMDGYDEASAALQRARVAVFTLNVTQANYNSLQAGLQTVAAETGGMYASTYEFPTRGVERVSQALEGYYVLFVEKPHLKQGEHRVEVRLARREGTVIARSKYMESR